MIPMIMINGKRTLIIIEYAENEFTVNYVTSILVKKVKTAKRMFLLANTLYTSQKKLDKQKTLTYRQCQKIRPMNV